MPPTTDGPLDPLPVRLIAAIEQRAAATDGVLLVGIDGRSGAGKSTLAAQVEAALPSAVVIKGDEFYAGAAQSEWDERSAEEKATLAIDWRRQLDVIETLARGEIARWHCYDWEAFDGRLAREATITHPADVVILEGAYSCRPELADRLDLTVLLAVDDADRLDRLRMRDGQSYRDDWLSRWTEAEDFYFSAIRPPSSFDLLLDGA